MTKISTLRPAVDLNTRLKKKGLDRHAPYPAVVVDDNDPDELCRIKVRVPKIHDHLSDGQLPWCIPVFNHHEGLKGGNVLDRSGVSFVAKKGHKVHVRFPTGDPSRPVYGGLPIDMKNKLPEMGVNYPFRIVMKLSYGMYLIIDTKTHEIFLTNPGDFNINILGDVDMTVNGNMTRRITNRKGLIPSYLLNASDTVLKNLQMKKMSRIPFEGLWQKGKSGYDHTHVTGDQTSIVEGNARHVVKGHYELLVDKTIKFVGRQHIGAISKKIDLN